MNYSRQLHHTRLFVAIFGAVTFLAPTLVLAQDAPTKASPAVFVRKNASTPQAAPDLAAFAKGMAVMKSRGCGDPTSWYYQGAIHWVPDDMTDQSNLAKGNPYCADYRGQKSQLKPAWNNCTHFSAPELHFVLWHRLYIFHLEKIVRESSGKADFALPYWDYCNPKYRVMPAAFRDPQSSLYAKARLPNLNAGSSIEAAMTSALDVTKLMQQRSFDLFNSQLDAAPHGAMHDYIGGAFDELTMFNDIYQADSAGLMSNVPSAAFDPIFWTHHANIDFLFQTWLNSPNGQKPDLSALEARPIPYTFFEPDGTKVSYTIADAYKMAFSLPVTYDTMEGPLASKATGGPKVNLVASSPGALKLDKRQSAFSLVMKPKAGTEGLLKKEKARAILHVKVSFTKEPRGVYEVFVKNTENAKLDSPEQLAGVMTFFGAAHHASHGAAHHKQVKEFRFDVTDEIDVATFDGKLDLQIRKQGNKKDDDDLTIEEVNVEAR